MSDIPLAKQMKIELINIGYWYPSKGSKNPVFNNLSLKIHKGEIIRIMGRNGCGKTTLLKIIMGELFPTKGKKVLRNKNLKIAYLDQDASSFSASALTIQEQLIVGMANILGPLTPVNGKAIVKKICHLLSSYELGLETRLDDFVAHLSGGQRQIISLLCVLLGETDVLLLDEFTSFMDEKATKLSIEILKQVVKDHHISLVYVSHQNLEGLQCDNQLSL